MMRLIILLLVAAMSWPLQARLRADYSMETGLELRAYPQDALEPEQTDGLVSLRLEPEAYWAWGPRRVHSVTASLFGRLDSADDERTHADIRELIYAYRGRSLEFRFGISRVFWGATESIHLVDIINQTDFVENPDAEDKLGQPMAAVSWISGFGTATAYLLPYFRERRFPGDEGRFRFIAPPVDQGSGLPLRVNTDESNYESEREQQHLDWALRWTHSFSGIDLGLSHFSGTARNPTLIPVPVPAGQNPPDAIELQPFYGLLEQTGLDATAVFGGLLAKLEVVYRDDFSDRYAAAAGGVEYTLSGILDSAWDMGLLAEYLWDERGKSQFSSPFDNELFLGTRLAGNDIAGTEILAGGAVDLDTQSTFFTVEASRRFGPDWKGVLELRAFSAVPTGDPLYSFSRDDYLSVELIRYF